MNGVIAILILLLSLLAWLGQVVSAVAPQVAAQLGLMEKETDVEPTFYVDARAECIWDAMILWVLPAAAGLHLADGRGWPLMALIGGGVYVYFAGRGIAQRILMERRGVSVGNPKTVKVFYLFLGLWGTAGLAAILLASFELVGRLVIMEATLATWIVSIVGILLIGIILVVQAVAVLCVPARGVDRKKRLRWFSRQY